MSESATADQLRNSKFFKDLPEDQLLHLAGICIEKTYRAREEMFHEHEHAKEVFLITSGKVALVISEAGLGPRQLMEVKEGDLVGWSPLLDRPRLSDTARTLTPVTAIEINGAKLIQLCEQNPEFGYQFMLRTAKLLAERLNALRWQLVDLKGTNLPKFALESD